MSLDSLRTASTSSTIRNCTSRQRRRNSPRKTALWKICPLCRLHHRHPQKPFQRTRRKESTGVIAMVDLLIADLDKEIQEIETSEKEAQEEYDTFMEDSADKRRADSQSVEEKEGAKADAEAALQKAGEDHHATLSEAMATAQYIGDLHTECDWLLMNYDARKAARTGEVESLTNAKAVLSGADYSLVQTNFLRRRA